MAKIWNPGAKPETVDAFLRAWCIRDDTRCSSPEVLFGSYECYCRCMGREDYTFGEFNAELERRGFKIGERFGAPVWKGIGLSLLEDGLVQRAYGARFDKP